MAFVNPDLIQKLCYFIDSYPDSITLTGEIENFLKDNRFDLRPQEIVGLLNEMIKNDLITIGGKVSRSHSLGNLPVKLSERFRQKFTTIH